MKESALRALPCTVGCVALATASGEPVPPSVVAMVALGSALLPLRMPLDRATQRLAMAVIVVLTIAAIRASTMPAHGPYLGAFAYGVALAPLILVAFRLWVVTAEASHRLDLSLILTSLLATAAARPGLAYLGFFLAFVASAIALQAVGRPHRLTLTNLSPRTQRIGAALIASAALSGATAAVFARFAYAAVRQRFQNSFQTALEDEAGISETARLGKLTKLLQSDAVVLRISGPPIDRLRGVVLDEYGGGRWTRATIEGPKLVEVPRTPPQGDDVVEVRHVSPDRDYVFLPLEAREVSTAEGELLEDSTGTAHSIPGDESPELWFRVGPRDALPVMVPRTSDLLMPHRLRAPLTAIASEWTKDATTAEEALAAIQTHLLRDYSYSLAPHPDSEVDPVLDFLTSYRKGHCEYFASALALLARSVGIPTRLVLGYRVGERNPYWSHYVVRRRNAHAWVEAYLRRTGTWVTVDPTPMTELPQDSPHDEKGVPAIFEAIAVAWERTEAWLAKRSIFEFGGAATLGVVVFALQRLWRTRRTRTMAPAALEFAPPSPAYLRLERALARRGIGREAGESIERWAARVDRPEISPVLLRYSRIRYGSEDNGGIEDDLRRAARAALQPAPPAAR